MRLRARLAVIVGSVSLVGGCVLGAWVAYGIRADATKAAEGLINEALDIVRNDPQRDPSSLIGYVQTSPVPLSVHVFFEQLPSVEVAQETDGKYPVEVQGLTIKQVVSAVNAFRTVENGIPILYRTLEIDSGEWVVVASSLRSIERQFDVTLRRSITSAVVVAVVVILIINVLTRRELKALIEISHDSTLIAEGNLDVLLPEISGPPEIKELSVSLHHMVDSLRTAIAVSSDSENRMREFLGDTAHELRTPLTVIRGYVDILSSDRELPSGQTERALRRLSHESKRMSSILNDLLLLAEMGEVRTSVDEVVDLSTIVHVCAQDLAEQQPDRPVTERIAGNVQVQGNSSLLERLLANIVANIRQHTASTTPVMFTLSGDAGQVTLTVDDGGSGLSDQMYTRAIEGFQRFDRNRSSLGGGFGLGLSIISSIVNAHNGTLEMKPSDLGGLHTCIVLPVTQKQPTSALHAEL